MRARLITVRTLVRLLRLYPPDFRDEIGQASWKPTATGPGRR